MGKLNDIINRWFVGTVILLKDKEMLRDRLNFELSELNDKVVKLTEFMHTDKFSELDSINQGLLMVQLEFMRGYMKTLERRLEVI